MSRSEEFVTGYHRTSPESAAAILRNGFSSGSVYFSDSPDREALNRPYGRSVVEVHADKDYVESHDATDGEFPGLETWSNAPARKVRAVRAWSER